MTLTIGETVEFDGKPFVLSYAHISMDRDGHTIRLEGMDPRRAQRQIDRIKRDQLAEALTSPPACAPASE